MMNKGLLRETIDVLKPYIDSRTGIELDNHDELINDIVDMLSAYELARTRKITVLSCCMLIRLGVRRHNQSVHGDNKLLTRAILDGDYLIGLVYRLAVSRKEKQFLASLTPFYKRIQLALLQGEKPDALLLDLKKEVKTYLDQQCA